MSRRMRGGKMRKMTPAERAKAQAKAEANAAKRAAKRKVVPGQKQESSPKKVPGNGS